MLKPVVILSVLLTLSRANAQMCPCEFGKSSEKVLRNEIGLNTYNVDEALINFTSPRAVYLQHFVNGFMFKHHFDKYSVRAGYDHYTNSYFYESNNGSNFNRNQGTSSGNAFRAGFEKTHFMGKVQAYAGVDLLLTTNRYKGTTHGAGDNVAPYTIDYTLDAVSYGFSPAVGIKYRPFRRFSVTAEASLSAVYYKTKRSEAFEPESNIAVLLNPLRVLSLNYHF